MALLEDIWTIFDEKGVARMHSQTLIDALLALDEGRWKRANGGRPIDAYYLREHLDDVITVNTPD